MRAITTLNLPLGRRRLVALALLCAFTAWLAAAAAAQAEVRWDVVPRPADTHLKPGGTGQIVVVVRNVGDTASFGTVEVRDHLPVGLTAIKAGNPESASQVLCVGTTTVVCKTNRVAEALSPELGSEAGPTHLNTILIDVAVSPDVEGVKENRVSVSGGGAAETTTDVRPLTISSSPAGFGIAPQSFKADAFDNQYPLGDPVRQAGAHPFEMRVGFDFDLKYRESEEDSGWGYTEPDGRVRDIETILPRGLIGNPEAVPKCQPFDFLQPGPASIAGSNTTGCPANTQVGVLTLDLSNGSQRFGFGATLPGAWDRIPLYNLVPPRGVAADFGFNVGGLDQGHIYASLDPARGYAVKSVSPFISDLLAVRAVHFTMWGVPGDPRHDLLRARQPVGWDPVTGEAIMDGPAYGASFTGAPIQPFLSTGAACDLNEGPFRMRVDSWGDPGAYTPLIQTRDEATPTGCDDPRVRFHPNLAIQPTTRAAGGPTGLDIHLESHQRSQVVDDPEELYAQNGNLHGIDTPPIKKVVVTFPEGMTISTSAAQGLGNCTPEQIGIGTDDPVTCPNSSQYGTLTLHTPLLPPDEPMKGYIYIAQQNHNPFGNFLSMYFVIQDPARGILVKIPGKIDLDPTTGQIKVTFDELPQFPVSDMQLTFKGGVRSALVNPSTCGPKTIAAEFYSYARPETPVSVSDSYDIAQKPDGSPCVGSLGARPFKPTMSAGTVNPVAGAYSPFSFRMTRTDDDQELSQIGVQLPAGLTAKIAGVTACPDEAIAAAAVPSHTGTDEVEHPSCPDSSLIGTTDVGSGVGVPLTYLPGKAYLAGPYDGASLSMVVITPILAGPYDLGVIVVRSAVSVDPETTAIHVLSDPFPQIYQGIPVRIRDVRVKIDRPQTMLNPTNCGAKTIDAAITGAGGDVNTTADDTAATLSTPFRVGECGALAFRPALRLRLKGGTRRGSFPSLTATLVGRSGDANLHRVVVTLPHSEFLEQGHLNTICTRARFAADECPAGSIYGRVKAWSPLLDEPLEGFVYLRSSNHQLPDLVLALRGRVNVDVVGRIDAVHAALRTTFAAIPDQPVSKVRLMLRGGSKGLLANSTNLCTSGEAASVVMQAQNGKTIHSSPRLQDRCGKAAHGKGKRRAAHGRQARRVG